MSNLTTGHGPAPPPSSAAAGAGADADADELASNRNLRRRRGCASIRHRGRVRTIGEGQAATAAAAAKRGMRGWHWLVSLLLVYGLRVGGDRRGEVEGEESSGTELRRGRGVRRLRAGKRRSGSCHEPGARPPHPRAAPRHDFFWRPGAPARTCAYAVRFCRQERWSLESSGPPCCVYRFLPLLCYVSLGCFGFSFQKILLQLKIRTSAKLYCYYTIEIGIYNL